MSHNAIIRKQGYGETLRHDYHRSELDSLNKYERKLLKQLLIERLKKEELEHKTHSALG